MQILQTTSAVVFVCIAIANVLLWILSGCRLPRYVHWIALIAFLLGGVGSYGIYLLEHSFVTVFWLPFLFAVVVYIVFILHGGAMPSGPTTAAEATNGFVYDKAEWHSGGDYPADLPEEQAFVHTGLYLGWIIDNTLYSEEFAEDNSDLIERFRRREVLPSEPYRACDGCLTDDVLGPEGNAFSRHYFNFKRGQFLQDYNALFVSGLPSLYHVAEPWETMVA